jgi:uncharacterized membrane protein YeaQ/YmgE (transglycosylase-associated protein family)
MLVGMVGAVLASMLSWAVWSAADGQLYADALLVSFLGAVLVFPLWACVAYGRKVSVPRKRAP